MVDPHLEAKYADTVARLEARHTVWHGRLPAIDHDTIADALDAAGIEVVAGLLDVTDYEAWMKLVDYPGEFPEYVEEFPDGPLLAKKSAEHYLSMILLDPRPSDVGMDVASSGSPIPDILNRYYDLSAVYRQDIRYTPGIHGATIGSDAARIPLPDAFIDKMTLHCSLEHFLGDSDTGFVGEAYRLLRPGGMACITPLHMAEQYSMMTSRYGWDRQGVPCFDPDAIISICEDRRLQMARRYDPSHLIARILEPAEVAGLSWQIVALTNWSVLPRLPQFTLLLTKGPAQPISLCEPQGLPDLMAISEVARDDGDLRVRGWALSEQGVTRVVVAWGCGVVEAECGLSRADVADKHPEYGCATAGFRVPIPDEMWHEGAPEIRVYSGDNLLMTRTVSDADPRWWWSGC